MTKFKSSTLWITISIIILNPIAWFLQYVFNRLNLEYLIDKGVEVEKLQQFVPLISFDLPIQTLATATVTAVGLYIGGNKARSVSYNMGQPKNSGTLKSDTPPASK